MTFEGAAQATTLDGAATKMETQTIARGPVAAIVAIKQPGTNGGGFFGPNSAHPFENPTPWTNFCRVVSILVLPMASIVMFGRMLQQHAARGGDLRRDARARSWHGPPSIAILAEVRARARPPRACRSTRGPNLEGKELRLGPVAGPPGRR